MNNIRKNDGAQIKVEFDIIGFIKFLDTVSW